jgi:tetratricopeptide (TPR) repeat protein
VERAIELLEKAARLAPDSAVDLSNLASAYIQAGRPGDALPLLDRAVRLDPRDPTALFNRARALEDLGRKAEAIAAWEAFVSRAAPLPDSAADLRQARQSLRALREGTAPR